MKWLLKANWLITRWNCFVILIWTLENTYHNQLLWFSYLWHGTKLASKDYIGTQTSVFYFQNFWFLIINLYPLHTGRILPSFKLTWYMSQQDRMYPIPFKSCIRFLKTKKRESKTKTHSILYDLRLKSDLTKDSAT